MTLYIDSMLLATAMRPRADAGQAFAPSNPVRSTRNELFAIFAARRAR